MRRPFLIVVVVLFALGASAFGQSRAPTQTLSANLSCATITVPSSTASTVAIYVGATTFSGTLQPQVIVNGGAAQNIQVQQSTALGTWVNTITANGTYYATVGPVDKFQLCFTSYVSGTATINMTSGTGVNSGLSAGGSGSGVSSVTGTANQIDSTGGTTPVLSLDPAIILPGTLTVPTGSSVAASGTGAITATAIPNNYGCPSGGTTAGTAAAQTLTVPNIPATVTANTCVSFTAGFAASGTTTLTVTPTGGSAYAAINLMKRTTSGVAALGASGDMTSGGVYQATYDGTEWVLAATSSVLMTGGANASGNVILGNAANQTTSSAKLVASSSTGAFTGINNLAVTGASGVSTVQASPSVITIGSGTSIGLTTLCTAALCPAGNYTIRAYVDLTTACGTSGTYTVLLTWTDDAGSKSAFTVPISGTGTTAGVLTTTSTSNWGSSVMSIRSTGATTIQYSTTAVACGSAGPMVGNLYLTATRE